MANLPTSGEQNWGNTLNEFLSVSHDNEGRHKGIVNVKDFGAVGDDSFINDDIFANAIAALPGTGGVLVFPMDQTGLTVYKITKPILFPNNKAYHIMGLGSNGVDQSQGVTIKNYGNDDAIWIKGKGTHIVENLDIINGLEIGTRTQGSGVRVAKDTPQMGSVVVTIRNVRVDGHNYGFRLKVPNISTIQDCVARNNISHGFFLEGWPKEESSNGVGAAGTSTSLINCFAAENTGNGFHHDGQGYCHYSNCASDQNINGYVLVNTSGFNPSGVTFTSCGAERNNGEGILLTNGNSINAIQILGGKFVTSIGGSGITINDAADVLLIGTKCTDNDKYGIDCTNTVPGNIMMIKVRNSTNLIGKINDPNNFTTQYGGLDVRGPSGFITGMIGNSGRTQYTAGSILFYTASGEAFRASGLNLNATSSILAGTEGVTRGSLTLWGGPNNNQPSYLKLHQPDGTPRYLFVDNSGNLRVHAGVPTTSEGTIVGTQS